MKDLPRICRLINSTCIALELFRLPSKRMVLRKKCQQPVKIAVAKNLSEPIAGGHEVLMLDWISHYAIVGALAKLKRECCY
jgi:hypothetical protein